MQENKNECELVMSKHRLEIRFLRIQGIRFWKNLPRGIKRDKLILSGGLHVYGREDLRRLFAVKRG